MELDWSVGEILKTLEKYGLEKNTLVIFTSDNGPANGEGSAGGLRGRKGTTWEGGVRVPFAARLPGQIPSGLVCGDVTATIDMLPTLAKLTGAKLPSKPLDGINIWPLFTGKQKQIERKVLLYWEAWSLTAARLGKWKLRFTQSSSGMGGGMPTGGQPGSAPDGGQPNSADAAGPQGGSTGAGQPGNPQAGRQPMGGGMGGGMGQSGSGPALYNLETDPDESYNAASSHPDVVADITGRVEKLVPGFPEEVQKAWAETKAKWTASGSAQEK
jgi:arylsulfatase